MIKKLSLILGIVILNSNLYSQKTDYSYWTEMCECSGQFDSTKVSRTQLQNTFEYLWWEQTINTDGTAWTVDQIDLLSIDSLENECALKIERLTNFEFVDAPFWNKIREEKIKYYEGTCQLKKYSILSYKNPDTLMAYSLTDSITNYYRKALIAGGKELLNAWIFMNEIQKSNSGNPIKDQEKFELQYNSQNKFELARVEIMKFGWWNNANHLLPHLSTSYPYESEFKKLLLNTSCDCDEP